MIKYSGYPVVYTEFDFEPPFESAYTKLTTALQSAGWDYVRPLSRQDMSHGMMLQSKRTPQGLQAKLAVYRGTNNTIYFRWYAWNELTSAYMDQYMYPRQGSMIRFIGNPYQFFTFKYNNTAETGNVMMGGIPWIPDFQAPLRIVSATPTAPIVVGFNVPHYYGATLVNIEGSHGLIGLDGCHQATAIDPYHLRLENSQGVGVYTPNSAILAGHDRLARCIWSQSTGYANGWLFHNPSNCLRYHLNSAPWDTLSLGIAHANSVGLVNQYRWVIPNDFGHDNKPAASRVFRFVPYSARWFDGTYIAHEPFLTMGEVSEDNDSRVVGQLWDSIVMNINFGQMDITTDFDDETWHVYTTVLGIDTQPADGVLCLKISNNPVHL